ncbi:MAG TPA: helix-turn-helix transcriptional regulator [Chloroflexota bacterium]|nr:helix-turn-helix transcriptional regulator [Chloroflexota bacterium]
MKTERPVSSAREIEVPSLAALRREKGWTAAQLARASGVEERVIALLEDRSVQRVARGRMERLADALGVDASNVAEYRPDDV